MHSRIRTGGHETIPLTMNTTNTSPDPSKQKGIKRQDGMDTNIDDSAQIPDGHHQCGLESGYGSIDYGNSGSVDTLGNLKKISENVPRISMPDSPVPLVRRTKSEGVSQMVAGRSRRDLACQNSMPIRKVVTFTKQDQAPRAPRICRTPTPYARLDSGDIEGELTETASAMDESGHQA